MERWLRRLLCRPTRNDLFRMFLIGLVVVYGSLFISTTTNISHNDKSASVNSMLSTVLRQSFQGTTTTGDTIYLSRNRLPILKQAKRNDQNNNLVHIPIPVRQDWVNGISEGNTNQYIAAGGQGNSNHPNLWDRSNVIPPWMKRKYWLLFAC
jgi:hypothetical protein